MLVVFEQGRFYKNAGNGILYYAAHIQYNPYNVTLVNTETFDVEVVFNEDLLSNYIESEHCDKEDVSDAVHPSHYKTGNRELIDNMVEMYGKEDTATWCRLTAQKCIARCTKKHDSPIEDIDKTIWYLEKYKELCQET